MSLTSHAKLFAIKLMIKDLSYSQTTIEKLLEEVDKLIEHENNYCKEGYKSRLNYLNNAIDNI